MPKRRYTQATSTMSQAPEPEVRSIPPCDRCGSSGLIPYWRFEQGVDDREHIWTLSAKCPCVRGASYTALPDIDHIRGIPRGLDHLQMNMVITALVAHPGLSPLEAIGFIPKTHAELKSLFDRIGSKQGMSGFGSSLVKRFVPEPQLLAAWKRIQSALLEANEDLEHGSVTAAGPKYEDELPF